MKKKGITPIISVVLLILITVGAVGVVYTQFKGLTGQNPGETSEKQQRLQSADYSIVSARDDGSNTTTITIRNNADVRYNLSRSATLMVGPDGNEPQALSALSGTQYSTGTNNCLQPDPSKNWAPSKGESVSCDTGIQFPSALDDPTTIELRINGVAKASYQCSVESSGQTLC